MSSKDFPVRAGEESKRHEHSEQAKPRKRCSSIQTTLRVVPLGLVCDRVALFLGQSLIDDQYEKRPAGSEKNAASCLPMEADQRDFL
jgi:hypothetical protein